MLDFKFPKSFFRRNILFISFLIILSICPLLILRLVFLSRIEERKEIEETISNGECIQVIVIGSSHAACIDIPTLGLDGINLALGGRDIPEIQYYLDFLIPRLPNLQYVFVSISYFSFFLDNQLISKGLADSRIAMYSSIPSFSYLSGDQANFLVGRFFPFVQPDHWQGFLKDMFNIYSIRDIKNDSGLTSNIWIPDSGVIQARTLNFELKKQRTMSKNPNVVSKNLTGIKKIISTCKQNNLTIVFFTPPYYHLYNSYYNSNDICQTDSIMQLLQSRYHMLYLNFSHDSNYCYNELFFLDEDHLNKSSKISFTKLIADSLKLLKNDERK